MSKKTSYSYIGVSFIILVFGIIFVPKIIDRVNNKDITRTESRSEFVDNEKQQSDLAFINVYDAPKKVPPFSFINQEGALITNNDYKGKVYIVEFFFTTCPSICPKMNTNLVEVEKALAGNKDFGIVSITINPTHDTKEVLKAYAEEYEIVNPNWNLLTGDKNKIYDLANSGFNLIALENDSVPGGFEHSGNFALIDKNGFIRSRNDQYGNPIIFYNGIISQSEGENDEGQNEEIGALIQDVKKLLKE